MPQPYQPEGQAVPEQPGETLRALLDRAGRLSPPRTMSMVAEVAAALHTHHRAGVVHAALTPEVLVCQPDGSFEPAGMPSGEDTAPSGEDAPPSCDASAPSCDAAAPSWAEATPDDAGRAPYLAPEQVERATPTAATDIYALGVIAYECLAGRPPFLGATPAETERMHTAELPPPLPDEIAPAVRTVVTAALARHPTARWSSAGEMSAAARAVLRPAPPESVRGRAPVPGRRGAGVSARAVYLAAAIATAVVLVITAFVVPHLGGVAAPSTEAPVGRGVLGAGPARGIDPPGRHVPDVPGAVVYELPPGRMTPPLRDGTCVYRVWFGNVGGDPVGRLRLYGGDCSGAAVRVAAADPSGVTFEEIGGPALRTSADACGTYLEVEATGHRTASGVGMLVRFAGTGHTLVFAVDGGTAPVPVRTC